MKISKFFLIAAAALVCACGETEENQNNDGTGTGGNEPVPTPDEVILEASANHLVANGTDEITFTVLGDGEDVTQYATIYDKDHRIVKDAKFSTTTTGFYSFWAAVGTRHSNTVKVQALAYEIPEAPVDPQPESLDFAHRTLITQFTGTACPYCPHMITALEDLSADADYNDKFILAACHTYNSDDPMYLHNSSLPGALNVEGYPTAVVGFTETLANTGPSGNLTNLKKAIGTSLGKGMKAGLAVNNKVTGNTLVIRTELKAVETEEFFVGCWLIEDNISASQSGDPSIKVHNNAIRIAESPYVGKSLGTVKSGETNNTLFTFELKESWKQENCHLIVFACVPDGKKYTVTNAITVPLNAEVAYEYK